MTRGVAITIFTFVVFGNIFGHVEASDGCSMAGAEGVCCQHHGEGPLCAQYSCGTKIDCANALTTRSDVTDLEFSGIGSSSYKGSDFFTNAYSSECPLTNCQTTFTYFGVKFESANKDAVIQYDEQSCDSCSYNKVFRIRCSSYPGQSESNYLNSNSFKIILTYRCSLSTEYTTVDTSTLADDKKIFSYIINERSSTLTAQVEKSITVTDYIQRADSTCSFTSCVWQQYDSSTLKCSDTESSYHVSTTKSNGDENSFTSIFKTDQAISNQKICLRCTISYGNSQILTVNGGPVQFTVIGCDTMAQINQLQDHELEIMDILEASQIIFKNYSDYYQMQSGYEGQTSTCVPTSTLLYYMEGQEKLQWPTNQNDQKCTTLAFMQSDLSQSNNQMGYMIVNLTSKFEYQFQIKVQAQGSDLYSNQFTLKVSCGPSSTTINEPQNIETIQTFIIDTGNSQDVLREYGKRPLFTIPYYSVSQTLCPINSYDLITSVQNQSAAPYLIKFESQTNQMIYIYVDVERSFTQHNYTFTLKVTADGGKIHYSNLQLNVMYDCQYDIIEFVSEIPYDNIRASDMVIEGDHPVLKIDGVVDTLTSQDMDLKTLFTNNASDYCTLQQFKINKVVNYSTDLEEPSQNYLQRMELNAENGLWNFKDMSTDYQFIQVYIQAYNGQIWSSQDDQWIIQINLAPVPHCQVTKLYLDSLTVPISTINPTSTNPYTYDIQFGDSQNLELNFDTDIRTEPQCDDPQISYPQLFISDSNNPEVAINSQVLPQIFTYDQISKSFKVNMPLDGEEFNQWAGIYKFHAQLFPMNNRQLIINVLEFMVIIQETEIQPQEDVDEQPVDDFKFENVITQDTTKNSQQKPNDDPKINDQSSDPANEEIQNYTPIRVWIDELTRDGILILRFNQPLKVPEYFQNNDNNDLNSLSSYNQNVQHRMLSEQESIQEVGFDDVFAIEIVSKSNQNEQDTNQQQEDYKNLIAIDPVIKNWTEQFTEIKLNFQNPLIISRTSSGGPAHYVKLLFKNTTYFTRKDNKIKLQQQEILNGLIIIAPRQLPTGVSQEAITSVTSKQEQTLKIVIIIAAIFLKAGSKRLIILIMAIQIVSYFPLYKVDFPAELELYIQALRKIAEFDILPTQEVKQWMIEQGVLERSTNKSQEQLIMEQKYSSAGFQTLDPFENLFGFLLIVIVLVILVLIVCTLTLFKTIREKVIEKLKSLRDNLFWSGIIQSIMLTYLKNFASCFMAYQLVLNNEHTVSTIIMIIITGGTLITFPIWSSFLLFRNKQNLQNEKFHKKYGGLYSDLKQNFKIHSPSVLLLPSLFVLRRATYVLIAMTELGHVMINLLSLILLSVLYFTWLEHVRPLQSRRLHRLEAINELFLLALCYQMICFTDLIPVETQISAVQPSFLYTLGFLILINLFALVIEAQIYSSIKRWIELKMAARKEQKDAKKSINEDEEKEENEIKDNLIDAKTKRNVPQKKIIVIRTEQEQGQNDDIQKIVNNGVSDFQKKVQNDIIQMANKQFADNKMDHRMLMRMHEFINSQENIKWTSNKQYRPRRIKRIQKLKMPEVKKMQLNTIREESNEHSITQSIDSSDDFKE